MRGEAYGGPGAYKGTGSTLEQAAFEMMSLVPKRRSYEEAFRVESANLIWGYLWGHFWRLAF